MSNKLADKILPSHLAVIMDGNGRWAKSRFLPRIEGHRAGAKTVRMVVEQSRRLGIRYLTLFAFSTENWGRPAEEVNLLMRLFAEHLDSELSLMLDNNIRLRAAGELERLPAAVRDILRKNEEQTKNADAMDLILAVSYGGREEILAATKKIALQVQSGQMQVSAIDSSCFRSNLYLPDVPDVDLLIRTSSEYRISNFLLWQLAYSEIVVTAKHWPEFSKDDLISCLDDYAKRERRFGLTSEQIKS